MSREDSTQRRLAPIPVAQLLARLGWQRHPTQWTVRCRDGRGRRSSLRIGLTRTGITIAATSPGPWRLTPLESGRLRGVVRHALIIVDRRAGSEPIRSDQRNISCSPATREQPGGRG
ncbi:MAG: hypothetical protein ACRDTA_18260 [Pseudonocardiaceae bacterium]